MIDVIRNPYWRCRLGTELALVKYEIPKNRFFQFQIIGWLQQQSRKHLWKPPNKSIWRWDPDKGRKDQHSSVSTEQCQQLQPLRHSHSHATTPTTVPASTKGTIWWHWNLLKCDNQVPDLKIGLWLVTCSWSWNSVQSYGSLGVVFYLIFFCNYFWQNPLSH